MVRRRKAKPTRRKRSKRSLLLDRAKKSQQPWEVAYRKRKRKSTGKRRRKRR